MIVDLHRLLKRVEHEERERRTLSRLKLNERDRKTLLRVRDDLRRIRQELNEDLRLARKQMKVLKVTGA